MNNLVTITDPQTGREYRVHPFIAEQGEWFPRKNRDLRALLPGITAFERDLARLAQASTGSQTPTQHSTASGELVLEEGADYAR